MQSRRRLTFAGASFSAMIFATIIVACYGATESKVLLSTDIDCSLAKNGIDIRAAATNAGLATSETLATSTACTANSASGIADLGSIVFVPSNDAENVVVQITLGVTRPTAQCVVAGGPVDGCIIARRQLSYVHHEALRVPIFLAKACIGKACDADTTCVNGECVSSNVASTCVNNVCALPNDLPPTAVSEAGLLNVGDSSILNDATGIFDDGGGGSGGDGSPLNDSAIIGPSCPPRPPFPAVCSNCKDNTTGIVCCIRPGIEVGSESCEAQAQCATHGVQWGIYACSDPCQCAQNSCSQGSSANGSCPVKTCGGGCDGTL